MHGILVVVKAGQPITCRRVLVTHSDGLQTVEEIEDDLGMPSTDIAAMKKF